MAYMYKRRGNWRAVICKDGKRKDINLGKDLNRAKIIKASLEQVREDEKFKKNLVATLVELGFIEAGTAVPADEKNVSWDLAKQKLLDHLEKIGRASKTLYNYRIAFESLESVLKPSRPADVTPQRVDALIECLLNQANPKDKAGVKKRSAGGVGVTIRTLKAAYQKFVRWQYVDRNPFHDCEMPKTGISLPRPLSPEEYGKLRSASNGPLRRCIDILVRSGMRPDELYHLPWRRVIGGRNAYIHIVKDGDWIPKAHAERMIPITPELSTALGRPGLPDAPAAGKNEYGLPVSNNWLERSFKRALKRSGLDGCGITVYSCRDTYATNLALEGHEAHVIAARLGHSNLQTSMRYVSLSRLNTADARLAGKKRDGNQNGK